MSDWSRQVIEPGTAVHFKVDGALSVRIGGLHGDVLGTRHEVANMCALVPMRWDDELKRYEVRHPQGGAQ